MAGEDVDLMLVPGSYRHVLLTKVLPRVGVSRLHTGVAFDAECHRLGHGKGFTGVHVSSAFARTHSGAADSTTGTSASVLRMPIRRSDRDRDWVRVQWDLLNVANP